MQVTLLRFADEFGLQRMKLQVADYLLRERAMKLRERSSAKDGGDHEDDADDILAGLPEQLRQYVLAAPSFAHALGAGPAPVGAGAKGS
jgi:hypothetical protein